MCRFLQLEGNAFAHNVRAGIGRPVAIRGPVMMRTLVYAFGSCVRGGVLLRTFRRSSLEPGPSGSPRVTQAFVTPGVEGEVVGTAWTRE